MAVVTIPPRIEAPGVEIDECPWNRQYIGTREALIAAGLACDGSFPGEPGQRKTVGYAQHAGRKLRIKRAGKAKFVAQIDFTKAETEALLQRAEVAKVLQREREHIDWLPKSAEDFRGRAIRFFDAVGVAYLNVMADGIGGYKVSEEGRMSVIASIAEARECLELATIDFSRAGRERVIHDIRAAAAKDNPAVRAMVDALIAGAHASTDQAEPR